MTKPAQQAAGEAGVATVMALAWIVVLTTLAWIAMLAAAATAFQHRVEGAADLAAVSAASRLQRGEDPCQVAEMIAARNDVSLQSCRVDGSDVVIGVSDQLRLPFSISRQLVAETRAGPVDD